MISDGRVLDGHGPAERRLERVEVVGDLAEVARRASRRPRSARPASSVQRELGGAVDGDVVVVVDVDEPAEAEVAGERARPRG